MYTDVRDTTRRRKEGDRNGRKKSSGKNIKQRAREEGEKKGFRVLLSVRKLEKRENAGEVLNVAHSFAQRR